jgi:hypothetical protein
MGQLTEQAQETFKTLLSRYQEDNYFYLVRNYLGLVKSPFHKPQLTNRLCRFFCQPAVQEAMIAALDELDLVILSLLALTGKLASEQITDLLKGSYSYGNLLRRVSNLQERMILLNDEGKLVFNPLIETQLLSLCSLKPLLGRTEQEAKDHDYCSTEFVRAYLSLVQHEGKLAWKDEYQHMFPSFPKQQLQTMFEALTEVMIEQSVLCPESKHIIDFKKAQQILTLDDHQLLCLLLAQGKGADGLAFASELLSLLQQACSFDTAALKLLLKLLSVKYRIPYDSTLFTKLTTWGLMTLDEIWYVHRMAPQKQRTTLLVDSDQTISYGGYCKTDDILYRFASLEVFDHQRRYHVTKESFLSALDNDLPFAEIKEYLEQNSSIKMSKALLLQLSLLNERYQNITVYDGLVLCCDERTANLVEHLSSISEHRIKTLAPTIFLMRRQTEEQWRQALLSAGQLVGSTKSWETIEVKKAVENPFFQEMVSLSRSLARKPTIATWVHHASRQPDGGLLSTIEGASLNSAQRQDLLHRYHAKMILSEEQIVAQVINPIIEAGGFDYQGKVSLARQAVGKKDIALQLQLTDQELVVQALEVAYTPQKEALLKAAVMPTMEVKILPISKIFLIRLVRFHLS